MYYIDIGVLHLEMGSPMNDHNDWLGARKSREV